MPRLAPLACSLLLATLAPAQPTLERRDLDGVLHLLQGAGLHEIQLRTALAQRGIPGLFELARTRAAALARQPPALAGGQLVLARQALAHFRQPAPAASPPPTPPATPPAPAPWSLLEGNLDLSKLLNRPATEGGARLSMKRLGPDRATLVLKVDLRTSSDPHRKGCMRGSGTSPPFSIAGGSFETTLNTAIGFRSVPASAPDPCTTMKPPQPMPLRVTGRVLPAGARAELSLHGPNLEIPAVLRVPGAGED